MQSVVAQRDVTIAKMIKAHKQSFDAKKPARDLLDQFFLDQVSVPMSRTTPTPSLQPIESARVRMRVRCGPLEWFGLYEMLSSFGGNRRSRLCVV